jgi:hypothetical protein
MHHVLSRRPLFLALLLLLMAGIPVAVSAATTFGSVTGPTKVGSDVQWTVTVTAMSNPDNSVCFRYRKPAGTGTWSTATACTCSGAQCGSGVGTWTCSATSATLAGGTVDWEMAGYSGNCGSQKTAGPTGTNSFGPTAVALNGFSAQGLPAGFGLVVPAAALVLAGGVALRRSRRS